jgi:pimeloyl-ACP methyl ester carboxylesterase
MPHQYFELNIDDHKLAVACLNPGAAGESVILLHRITGSISFWEAKPARYILDLGPCYSVSLPGHFPAVAPDNFKNMPLTTETLVTLLEKAIRQIAGKKPVTVIGHSTGGFAALALAAYKPEIIRRVVSISGFAHGRWTGSLGLLQHAVKLGWLGESYFKLLYRMLMLAPAVFRWGLRFYAADSQALYANPDNNEGIECSFPNFRRLALDDIIRYFKDMPQIDITSQLANIRAKTLVITGDGDPSVPPSQSYEIARLVPGAKLITIKGAGHVPFLERPVEYNQSLSDWLAHTI